MRHGRVATNTPSVGRWACKKLICRRFSSIFTTGKQFTGFKNSVYNQNFFLYYNIFDPEKMYTKVRNSPNTKP